LQRPFATSIALKLIDILVKVDLHDADETPAAWQQLVPANALPGCAMRALRRAPR
jgi:hypothetical protein